MRKLLICSMIAALFMADANAGVLSKLKNKVSNTVKKVGSSVKNKVKNTAKNPVSVNKENQVMFVNEEKQAMSWKDYVANPVKISVTFNDETMSASFDELKCLVGKNVSFPKLYSLLISNGHSSNIREGDQTMRGLSILLSNAPNLKDLYMSSNNDGKLLNFPKEIGNLKNLQRLYLDYNKLTNLPKEIGNLKNLQILDLHRNQLTSLPKEIGNLKNLQELDLRGNQLTNLPKEIGNLKNLEELILGSNQLTNLPKEIGNLKKLKQLSIDAKLYEAQPQLMQELESKGVSIYKK